MEQYPSASSEHSSSLLNRGISVTGKSGSQA
jgi:hypothetical protein